MKSTLKPDFSLFFEDFNVGDSSVSQGRTITESDVYLFAGLTGDFSAIHLDKTVSESGNFGKRIVQGLLVMSLSEGLKTSIGLYRTTGVASLGYNDWRFIKPVFFGDTIYLKSTVVEKKETSNKTRGILFLKVEIFNQKEEIVQEGIHVLMIKRKSNKE